MSKQPRTAKSTLALCESGISYCRVYKFVRTATVDGKRQGTAVYGTWRAVVVHGARLPLPAVQERLTGKGRWRNLDPALLWLPDTALTSAWRAKDMATPIARAPQVVGPPAVVPQKSTMALPV